MCGIVGYVGHRSAAPILIDGLRRLEYRGYDSAGIAVHVEGRNDIVRAMGKLRNLEGVLVQTPLHGNTGIGHTRWATHGRPSEVNAHPHAAGPIAVVHNGIIENHTLLRRQLQAEGVHFSSETDTEIVAHLIHAAVRGGADLVSAVRTALARVQGAYAIAVLSHHEPRRIVVAKSASPLVLGLGDGESFCASDVPALLPYTRDMLFLEDGELAVLEPTSVRVETLAGQPVQRAARRIDWSPVMAEKAGFKHFMLKEIFEQPRALEDTLRGRLDRERGDIHGDEIGLSPADAGAVRRVVLLACGTSHHATLAGRYYIENLAGIAAVAELASE